MGITDKVTGKAKQAAGDLAGDEGLRDRGAAEERKGEVKAERDEQRGRAEEQEARAAGGDPDEQERLKDEQAWEKGREAEAESLEKQT